MSPSPVTPFESTDAELLFRFLDRGEHAAFRQLVERHARLVSLACRNVLRHEQDVEDAFQATFLVLIRKAHTLRSRSSLGAWLFQVARRVSLRAASRRREVVSDAVDPTTGDDVLAGVQAREEFALLAVELERLPERYRLPIVLHDLEGRTRAATAEQLECTEAAVKARLARGRRMLRHRLMRRGVALSVVVATTGTASASAAAGDSALVASATAAALQYHSTGTFGSACSAGSPPLTTGVSTMGIPLKASAVGGVTLAATLVVAAGVALSQSPRAGTAATVPPVDSVADEAAGKEEGSRPAGAAVVAGPRNVVATEAGSQPVTAEAASAEKPPAEEGFLGLGGFPSPPVAAGSPPTFELTTMRPSEERIRATLEEPTNLEFIDVPLEEVLLFLSDTHEIPVVVDEQSLEEEGVPLDEPVRRVVSVGITLESGLNLILDPLELAYYVDDEVMKVASRAHVEAQRETRLYALGELLDAGLVPEPEDGDLAESLEEILLVDEGASHVAVAGRFAIVTQSPIAHRRTRDVVEMLHRAAERESRESGVRKGGRQAEP